MPPDTHDFRVALNLLFKAAIAKGLPSVVVNAGDLHRRVGEYPGRNHRMPICCDVMKENMRPGDLILNQPPKGKGASLTIKYMLPRS
jgi:5-methylcytosine-specific restriction protein A